jgi:hypothetical protein
LAAAAGVSSVWLAPALAGAGVQRSGVIPCTCADALDAGTITKAATARVAPVAKRNVDICVLHGVGWFIPVTGSTALDEDEVRHGRTRTHPVNGSPAAWNSVMAS